ncbi:MAG: alpha/beta fold hydrolase [Verrucomicrobiota bacterium JB022]|nr:alpha/beta fold hydrolase [Verrucomicrobiota bacterium JB022]
MKRWFRRLALVYLLLLIASHVVRWQQEPHAPREAGEKVVTVASVRGITAAADEPVEIAYRSQLAEDPGAPNLILLHGSPVASVSMEGLFAQFPGYNVYAPDLPGLGASTREVPDYSIKAHALYTLEFMDALGIERAHVVGYSMGGGPALILAEMVPERVKSIVMLSSIGVQEYELFGRYDINHAVHGFQLAFFWLLQEAVPHFGWLDDFPLNLSYARNFYDTDQRPLRRILSHYHGPMLILQGTEDTLVPPEAAEEHHRLVPQSELHLLPGGHIMLMQQPEVVGELCREFFARVEQGQVPTRAQMPAELRERAQAPFERAETFGYTGMALVVMMLLIVVATLVSEDLTCIVAGLIAAQGLISVQAAMTACLMGIFIGDVGLYLMGRYMGRRALRKRPFKWLVSEEQVERAARWFHERGSLVIFITRFLPGTRAPVYFTAGSVHAPWLSFITYFGVAALIWTPIIVGLAYKLGDALLDYYHAFEAFTIPAILLVGLLMYLIIHYGIPLCTWRGRRLLLSRYRRSSRWEFWPLWKFNTPLMLYAFWHGLTRYRNPLLFTCVNPAIPHSGFIGESKSLILTGLAGAGDAIARWRLIAPNPDLEARWQEVEAFRTAHGWSFPLVLKPDEGQRGLGVAIVRRPEDGREYLRRNPCAVIAQEYIPGREYGVFYARKPSEPQGRIISLTIKEMTSVTGDGEHDLEHLILADDRAVCLAPVFLHRHHHQLARVPAKGERVPLIDIGTHARGALFLDGMHLITPGLTAEIDRIAKSFEGFHFGRFDIRVPPSGDIAAGRELKVIELNGVTSESTHIYDPRHKVDYAYRTMRAQWRLAYAIAAELQQRGARPWTWRQFLRHWWETHRRQGVIKRSE